MEFCNLLYAFPSNMFLQRRKRLCEIIKLEESPNPHLLLWQLHIIILNKYFDINPFQGKKGKIAQLARKLISAYLTELVIYY